MRQGRSCRERGLEPCCGGLSTSGGPRLDPAGHLAKVEKAPNSLQGVARCVRPEMRFLWTCLIVVIVFAFGFIWASMFTVGMPPPRRAPRRAEPNMSNFYQE